MKIKEHSSSVTFAVKIAFNYLPYLPLPERPRAFHIYE